MPVNKDLPPMTMDGDELVIGRGANAIRVKGANLKVQDASTHVHGHYPDMYPWDTPHRHPEWDVRRSHACDLHWPPDNIPVAAIPAAIRELKRIAVGGWVVNAPTSEDLLEGAVVRWDSTQEMWVAALAVESEAPADPEKPGCDCGCQTPTLPDTDLPQAPNKPVTPVKLPCTDFDARLDTAPTQAISPEFMGIVIGPNAVQTHGVVRHSSFAYPARTPLYLSDTEPGRVTTEDTGVFVGMVLVPGTLLLNVEAQVLDKYLVLVKEELKTKIECAMQQLVAVAKKLGEAIKDGDELNAAALKALEDFITLRLQQLQSFLDNVNRQYEELLIDLGKANEKLDALEASLSEAESDGGKGHVVNTIAGRDTFVNSPEGTVVFVRDASDDPAVKTGPATYILVGQGPDGYWANITSSVSLEGDDLLSGIDVTALQSAIAKAHGHDNKALLDSITSFGEHGVKIGDTIIIESDGTYAYLTATTPIPTSEEPDSSDDTTVADMAKDLTDLKQAAWVVALDDMPTEENFAEMTKNVPDGGLYSVPSAEDTAEAESLASAGLAVRSLFQKKDGAGIPVSTSSAIDTILARLELVEKEASRAKTINTRQVIRESGTFTAPASGFYLAVLISGGAGGYIFASSSGKGSMSGTSGHFAFRVIYLEEGQEVPVIIGAGGPGVGTSTNGYSSTVDQSRVGGATSFGEYETAQGDEYIFGPTQTSLPDVSYSSLNYGYGAGGMARHDSAIATALPGGNGAVILYYNDPDNEPTGSQNPSEN